MTPSRARSRKEQPTPIADALIRDRIRFRPLYFRYIVHIGRLQSRQAAAEHRIDRKLAEELEDRGEKRVIRSEHYRRADECGPGKYGAERPFAFATLANIK